VRVETSQKIRFGRSRHSERPQTEIGIELKPRTDWKNCYVGRPLIRVYAGNFEKIQDKLKGVKWDPLI
jgi:hypothetical protein